MKFSIRDVLWLTVVAALALGWWLTTPPPIAVQVSGSISVAGTALPLGRVLFHSADGQIVGAQVNKGKYSVPRVPVGAASVTVEGNGAPAKYAATNSGLTVQVIDAKNVFDFDLR